MKNRMILAGSTSALNTIRREKQHLPNQPSSGAPDYDPFSLKNSTKDFRVRCDKVGTNLKEK